VKFPGRDQKKWIRDWSAQPPPTWINEAKSIEDLMNHPWYWRLNSGFMNVYPKTPADIEDVIS